tara:strand:- start:25 stop:345 length:321 start_codon:yes stop_codon:yes gene_type:complete
MYQRAIRNGSLFYLVLTTYGKGKGRKAWERHIEARRGAWEGGRGHRDQGRGKGGGKEGYGKGRGKKRGDTARVVGKGSKGLEKYTECLEGKLEVNLEACLVGGKHS